MKKKIPSIVTWLIAVALWLCITWLVSGCSSHYCPSYSSGTYNAAHKGKGAKYNNVRLSKNKR